MRGVKKSVEGGVCVILSPAPFKLCVCECGCGAALVNFFMQPASSSVPAVGGASAMSASALSATTRTAPASRFDINQFIFAMSMVLVGCITNNIMLEIVVR